MVDSRDNIAKLIGGPAPAFVTMFKKLHELTQLVVFFLSWIMGQVLGFLSLVKLVLSFLHHPYTTLRMSQNEQASSWGLIFKV